MKNIAFIVLSLCSISSVFGQDAPEKVVADTTKKESKGELTISGFVDVYYSYNLNNPGAAGNWGTNGAGRIFDVEHNQIILNMVQAKVSYAKDRFEVVSDLLFGPGAELANFGNTGTAFAIKQAYVSYGFTDKLKLTAGQYGSHIGYEFVDSPENFNYSLSYLFGNGPFYHAGAKLEYAFNDKFALMGGVVNGWSKLKDNNQAKSITAQIAIEPNDDFSLYLNWIGGDEDPASLTGDTIKSYMHMFDLTTSYAVTDKFNIGFNGAYGMYTFDTLETKTWGGAAIYLNYDFCKLFALGTRIELFDDMQSVQNVGAAYTGYTLTGIFKLADEHFLIKPEFRYDTSNEEIYFTHDSAKNSTSQFTAALTIIGKF